MASGQREVRRRRGAALILVSAYGSTPSALRPDWRMMLVGLMGSDTANVEAWRRELGLEDSLMITGWIARAELYQLFRTAAAFLFPSAV